MSCSTGIFTQDVVVVTPFRLTLHLGKANMVLNEVRHVVFDEADTLCDTFYQKERPKSSEVQ